MTDRAARWPWLVEAPTILGLLEARAGATPDSLLFVDEADRSMTCADVLAAVERVAQELASAGIRPGSRVAWQLPTRISTYVVMLALRRLGAVQAPIIPQYRQREVTQSLVAVTAQHYLIPGEWMGFDYELFAESLDLPVGVSPKVTVIDDDNFGSHTRHLGRVPPRSDPDAVAWNYFTSGSSGPIKAVRHTDDTLLNAGIGFAGHGRLGEMPDEFGAVGFPVAHVGGAIYLIAALAGGFPVLLIEAFAPHESVALMRRHRVTTTGGAPPFYQALVAVANNSSTPVLPTLRTLKGGGAPCSPALFGQVRQQLGATVAHDYGMTEIPMIAAADPRDPDDVLAATDGRVVPGNELRISASDGRECAAGEQGEIQVRGRGVCLGYVDHAQSEGALTADGWFKTGDLGVVHPSGHVEVVGRVRDVIIRKGENVAPAEIEELLITHLAVAEAAVIGLPDPERGELVCAVLVVVDGQTVDMSQVQQHLAQAGLMKQKWPERIEFLGELPRTGLAKVDKQELKRRFVMSNPSM